MKKSIISTALCVLATLGAAAAMPEYNLDPADGSIVKDLSMIQLSFPGETVKFAERNDTVPVAVLTNTVSSLEYVCLPGNYFSRENDGVLTYYMNFVNIEMANDGYSDPVTDSGEYHLSVKDMFVPSTGEVIDSICADYEILYPVKYETNPTSGTVNRIDKLILTFPDTDVLFYKNNRMSVAVIQNKLTEREYYCENPVQLTEAPEGGSSFSFEFVPFGSTSDEPTVITQPGTYVVTVRAFGYRDGTSPYPYPDLPPLKFKYVILPGGEQPDQPQQPFELPDATVAGFGDDYVDIVWGYYTLLEETPEIYADVTLPDGSVVKAEGLKTDVEAPEDLTGRSNANNAIRFSGFMPTVAQHGEFSIDIPSEIVNVNFRAFNKAQTVSWTVPETEDPDTTGIASAATAEGPFDVYDIAGRLVLSDATSLDALPAGLYIVNGRKVAKTR